MVRIGVAQDQAFCFYYPDNLELLEAEGAELVKFSPLNDQVLPDVDMLYLGGGYPELHGEALAGNVAMRTAIRQFAERGGLIYAECGGMMYLTQAIRDLDGKSHEMVGLFPAEAVMSKVSMTLGYRELQISQPCVLGEVGVTVRGHEFHYSLVEPKGQSQYACTLTDAQGKSKGQDGLIVGNTVGLYSHLHFASQPQIAASLFAVCSPDRSPIGCKLRRCEMTDQDEHKAKMERLKASVDRRIEAAQEEKGLLIVYTGAGKGKTTAALGMALRCIGHGMKVAVVQFIKGAIDTAEERALKSFGDRVTFLRMGEGYTWETQDRERDTTVRPTGLGKQSAGFLRDPSYAMVILDEFNIALQHDYVRLEDVLPVLRAGLRCSMS